MTDFGRYRLSYEPGPHDPYSGVLESTVEMSISGEAELSQLTDFFDSFLRAAGYVFEGKVQIVKPTQKPDHRIADTVISGGTGTDTIYFGAAQPASLTYGIAEDILSFK